MKSGESNLNRIVIVQCNFIGGNDVVEGKIVKSFFSSSKKLFCAQIIEIIARKQFRARKLRVEEIMGKVFIITDSCYGNSLRRLMIKILAFG